MSTVLVTWLCWAILIWLLVFPFLVALSSHPQETSEFEDEDTRYW